MKFIWLFIPALMLFGACHNKEIQVKNGIDSVQYFAEQHAKAERSLKEANAIIDKILLEARPGSVAPVKERSIADRLFELHAAVKQDQKQKASMAKMVVNLRNQANAYEMMAVALKDELEYRDQSIAAVDTVRAVGAMEPSSPATAKAEVIYINFPEK
jgi:hypothetical protein